MVNCLKFVRQVWDHCSQTPSCVYLWINSWNIDFILCFNNPLLKLIMQNSLVKLDSGGVTVFSICINRLQPSFTFLYIYPLFSRFSLLKHPAWHLVILRSLKHAIGTRNVWNICIGICDLTVGRLCNSRNLSNSSRRPDQVSVWIWIIHLKSRLLKRRIKSIFHEWVH